jgi:hypothetical protein
MVQQETERGNSPSGCSCLPDSADRPLPQRIYFERNDLFGDAAAIYGLLRYGSAAGM